jgi:hypothetical protein
VEEMAQAAWKTPVAPKPVISKTVGEQLQIRTFRDIDFGGINRYSIDISCAVTSIEMLNLPEGREFYLEIDGIGNTNSSAGRILKMDTLTVTTPSGTTLSTKDLLTRFHGPINDDIARFPQPIKASLKPCLNFCNMPKIWVHVTGNTPFKAYEVTMVTRVYNIMSALMIDGVQISAAWHY